MQEDRGGDNGIGRNNSIDSDPNRGVWTRPGGVDGGSGIDRGNFTSGVWNRPAGTGIGGAGHLDPVHNGGFWF